MSLLNGRRFAALDVEIEIVEHDEIAVHLARVFQLKHRAAALRARRKHEVNFLPLWRNLDWHHFLEQLDAALHLRRLRRLVAESIDEHSDPRHLFVLLTLRLAQRLDPRFVLDQEIAVVADVIGQRSQREVGNA